MLLHTYTIVNSLDIFTYAIGGRTNYYCWPEKKTTLIVRKLPKNIFKKIRIAKHNLVQD